MARTRRPLSLRRAARDIAAAEHQARAPKGSVADLDAVLATLGAVRFVLPRGYWCYVLRDAAREPFYVGISGNLLRRTGEHVKAYGNKLAYVDVIRCRSEHEARVTQLMLADRFDGYLRNHLGTAEYERYRAELHRTAKAMDLPAHLTAAWGGEHTRAS
jgi:hypothetical protein